MKKLMSLLIAAVMMTLMIPFASAEDDVSKVLGTWYYVQLQDDAYPGTTFATNGESDSFTIYTDGENLISVIHQPAGEDRLVKNCTYQNGVLKADFEYTLDGDMLVASIGGLKLFYAREPQERIIRVSISESSARVTPEDFNGVYDVIQYGEHNAFVNADEIGLSGEAEITDGKLVIKWALNQGEEQKAEISFDSELNLGRLYTVVNESTSYIVSILSDGTLFLNVGLYEAQWILKKRNAPDTDEVYHLTNEVFEEAYQKEKDWFATEESRNQIAAMLLKEVPEKEKIDTEGSVYLMSVGGAPLLLCEGQGENRNYIFSIGRGFSEEEGAFIYYSWKYALNYKSADESKTLLDSYIEWMNMFQSWKVVSVKPAL